MSSSKQNTQSTGTQVTSGTSSTTPWAPQASALQNAFSQAQNAYNKTMATGPYMGDYVAQDNGQGAAAANQAFNFGTNAQNQQDLVGNLTGASGQLLNSGVAANQAGISGLQGLLGDQTQNIINDAGQYANNPNIDAAVRASVYDAQRTAAENVIPNLYRSAAGSNTLNSDRAALSQGVVDRGIAEQALNNSANMRYNAYNSGINTASNDVNARRSGYGNLSSLGQTAAGLGTAGLGQAEQNQSLLNQMAYGGAEYGKSLRQDNLDNQMQKYQGQTNFPWQALQNYYGIVGANNWGGNTTYSGINMNQGNQTTTSTPSATNVAGGILGGLGSLFSGGAGSAASGLYSFLK